METNGYDLNINVDNFNISYDDLGKGSIPIMSSVTRDILTRNPLTVAECNEIVRVKSEQAKKDEQEYQAWKIENNLNCPLNRQEYVEMFNPCAYEGGY